MRVLFRNMPDFCNFASVIVIVDDLTRALREMRKGTLKLLGLGGFVYLASDHTRGHEMRARA